MDMAYLEDFEPEMKSGLVFLEACELNMDRAMLAANTHAALCRLNDRATVIRATACEGNFDDLVSIYEEAGSNDSKEKKKGLIARAWDTIKKFFKNMREALFGKHLEKNIDDAATAEVPKGFKKLKTDLANLIGKLKAILKPDSPKKAIGEVVILASAVIATLGAIHIFKNKKGSGGTSNDETEKMTGKEAKDLAGALSDAEKQVENLADSVKSAEINALSSAASSPLEELKAATDPDSGIVSTEDGDDGMDLASLLKMGAEALWTLVRNKIGELGHKIKEAYTWIISHFKKGGDGSGTKEESWGESWDDFDAMIRGLTIDI